MRLRHIARALSRLRERGYTCFISEARLRVSIVLACFSICWRY